MDPREEKLPQWARQLIDDLRKRVQYGNEPNIKELATLRPQIAKLKAQNDALNDLLSAAAKGGHLTSQQIVEVIVNYAPWKD